MLQFRRFAHLFPQSQSHQITQHGLSFICLRLLHSRNTPSFYFSDPKSTHHQNPNKTTAATTVSTTTSKANPTLVQEEPEDSNMNSRQRKPFQFYSFEDEIKKLKQASDEISTSPTHTTPTSVETETTTTTTTTPKSPTTTTTSTNIQRQKPKLNHQFVASTIQTLNSLYRSGEILAAQPKPTLQSPPSSPEVSPRTFASALDLVKQVLNQSTTECTLHEKALVLETFLHNILLALLCDTTTTSTTNATNNYKSNNNSMKLSPQSLTSSSSSSTTNSIHQAEQKPELSHTLQVQLREFLLNWINEANSLQMVLLNVTLFKFLVKSFEVLHVPLYKTIPFIETYLTQVTQPHSSNESNYSRNSNHKHPLRDHNPNNHVSCIQDISMLLLPISDYVHESSQSQFTPSQQQQQFQQRPLNILPISTLLSTMLKRNSKRRFQRDEISAMCKSLFCVIRINASANQQICFDLTEALLKSSGFVQLTEIEMTSLLYSISKINQQQNNSILNPFESQPPQTINNNNTNNKDKNERFETTLQREMPALVLAYEIKIEKMLSTRYFHYARVPYILYCLQHAQKYRHNTHQNVLLSLCMSLCDIALKNYEKFKPSEITTIIYSLKSIDSYAFTARIHEIYRGYFLKLALDSALQQQSKQYQSPNHKSTGSKQTPSASDNNNKSNIESDLIDDTILIESQEEQYMDQHMSKQFLESDEINKYSTTKVSSYSSASNANTISRTIGDSHHATAAQTTAASAAQSAGLRGKGGKISIQIPEQQQQQQQQQLQQSNVNQMVSQPNQESHVLNATVPSETKQEKENTSPSSTAVGGAAIPVKVKAKSALDSLQGVDILCLLMGVRENEKRKRNDQMSGKYNSLNPQPVVSSITVINQQLFQLFLSKMSDMPLTLQVKILYEMAYNHVDLLDAYLFDKHFKPWVITLSESLSSLNSRDFIALAYIMKKFARLFGYHIQFWMKFAKEAQQRTFAQGIETNRVFTVLQNMQDFTRKCLQTAPKSRQQSQPHQQQQQKWKQDTMRTKSIETLNLELTAASEALSAKSHFMN